MKLIGSLMIAAFLVLFVSDARAQETSISLNVNSTPQLQKTPALVVRGPYNSGDC